VQTVKLNGEPDSDEARDNYSLKGLIEMIETRFRPWVLAFAFGVLLLVGTNVTIAQTATTVSTTIKEPLDFASQTCGVVEPIKFTGTQDTLYEVVNDGTGRFTLKVTSNWQNVVGTTPGGLTFQGTNTSDETIDLDSLPSEQAITVNQRWMGKDDTPNLVYTLKFNIKIDADGKVTSTKSSETAECEP
jgi:hypothetical protein